MTDRETFEAACLEMPTEAAGPFDWAPAPKRTEWGAGMVLADVEIDLDPFSAATTMRKFGGSFAKCIAEAYFAADDENSATLVNAFTPLFLRYYTLSQQDARAAG